SKRNFKPNLKTTLLLYKSLNTNIFNNKLKFMPKFYIRRLHGVLGMFEYNPRATKFCYSISLTNKFLDFREFASILGHEMVHFYQFSILKLNSGNHNKDFYKFRKKFIKLGLDLQREYR
ncbi:MAG: SprT-like domain-containing protein, partial [Proteobacteria bacterium]|nr:SprT-like domain-containing protein [Pseudomonadota bacterium]